MRLALTFVSCVIPVLAACGSTSSNPDPDSGLGPSDDSGMMQGGPPLPAATINDGAGAPNLSCTPTFPVGGAPVTFTAHVYDFQSGTGSNVPNANVEVFSDNVVRPDCPAPSCASAVSDANGLIRATAPSGGLFSYRIAPTSTTVLTIGYNREAPTSDVEVDIPNVGLSTVNLIPVLFGGRRRASGTVTVSGEVQDCDGEQIANAIVRVFRADGTEVVEGTRASDPFAGYFSDNDLPDPDLDYTNDNGIFAFVNAPLTAGETIRVEIWASETAQAPSRRVACEQFVAYPDSIAIVTVGPTRSDYPAGSPCL